MINKRGGIVAIEPKSGEILALSNSSIYDPGILVGRQRSKNYTQLYRDLLLNHYTIVDYLLNTLAPHSKF
jgi:penicillin-binding protein 2